MLDRTKAPEIHEIDAVTLQIAEVTNLNNGAKLHTIISETQPVVRLDFVFKAGKWYENKVGVSDLTAKMLLEGTTNLTAKQIADKVDFYGASLEVNHGYDRSELTLYCLAKYVSELLPLITEVLESPSFPESEFNLLKQRSLQNLKIQRQKNSYLATNAFTKEIYGSKHPYTFGFEEDELHAVTLQELKDFYKQHYNTQQLEVFACGAIDDSIQKLIADSIQNLSICREAQDITSHKLDLSDPVSIESRVLVDMPESLQSSIRIGCRFPHNSHPDYLSLLVMNELLGGYFGSRLMKNIREDKGYTYGIYSAISPKEHDTLFFIGTDVKHSVTEDTINEVLKEITSLQQQYVPEDELSTVKNYMLGKFLNDIATIFEQCDRYKKLVLQQLPFDYYNNYINTVRNITPETIQQLAQKYLDIDKLKIAIAGRY